VAEKPVAHHPGLPVDGTKHLELLLNRSVPVPAPFLRAAAFPVVVVVFCFLKLLIRDRQDEL
jgi:hypothetical protein